MRTVESATVVEKVKAATCLILNCEVVVDEMCLLGESRFFKVPSPDMRGKSLLRATVCKKPRSQRLEHEVSEGTYASLVDLQIR